eukprot:3633501-Pyramimonas_sp.AAC.1
MKAVLARRPETKSPEEPSPTRFVSPPEALSARALLTRDPHATSWSSLYLSPSNHSSSKAGSPLGTSRFSLGDSLPLRGALAAPESEQLQAVKHAARLSRAAAPAHGWLR